jgi:hypothetical protein
MITNTQVLNTRWNTGDNKGVSRLITGFPGIVGGSVATAAPAARPEHA